MKFLTQKTIDIIQWIFIVGLIALLSIQGFNYRQIKKDLVTAAEYNKENTYVRIYESQKLNKLKRENKELYDSIAKLESVESGMVIKFREHYNTDTILVANFIVERDTIRVYDNEDHTDEQTEKKFDEFSIKINAQFEIDDKLISDKFLIDIIKYV